MDQSLAMRSIRININIIIIMIIRETYKHSTCTNIACMRQRKCLSLDFSGASTQLQQHTQDDEMCIKAQSLSPKWDGLKFVSLCPIRIDIDNNDDHNEQ